MPPDRRQNDVQHCEAHEQNTRDIAAIKASLGTSKWFIVLGMPIVIAMLAAVYTKVDDTSAKMIAIQTTVDHLDQRVIAIEARHGKIDERNF